MQQKGEVGRGGKVTEGEGGGGVVQRGGRWRRSRTEERVGKGRWSLVERGGEQVEGWRSWRRSRSERKVEVEQVEGGGWSRGEAS